MLLLSKRISVPEGMRLTCCEIDPQISLLSMCASGSLVHPAADTGQKLKQASIETDQYVRAMRRNGYNRYQKLYHLSLYKVSPIFRSSLNALSRTAAHGNNTSPWGTHQPREKACTPLKESVEDSKSISKFAAGDRGLMHLCQFAPCCSRQSGLDFRGQSLVHLFLHLCIRFGDSLATRTEWKRNALTHTWCRWRPFWRWGHAGTR